MSNKNFIAESVLGVCPICLLTLDVSEWISERENGRLVHLGCVARAPMSPPADAPQFELFSDNELETAIEVKNEIVERAEQVFGSPLRFDGVSLLGVDVPRLAGQLLKVFQLMSDGKYRTESEVADEIGALPTSAGARLRDSQENQVW